MKTALSLFALPLLLAPALVAQEQYGTIKATVRIRGDGTKSTTIVDPDKHTAEETITDNANKPLKKTTYLLDENSVAMGAIFWDGKGNMLYRANYKRDDAGRVTEADFLSADNVPLGKRVFTYEGNAPTATQVADYDANGQLLTPAAATAGAKKRH